MFKKNGMIQKQVKLGDTLESKALALAGAPKAKALDSTTSLLLIDVQKNHFQKPASAGGREVSMPPRNLIF